MWSEAPPVAIHAPGNPILADGRYYSTDPAPVVVGDTLWILAGRDEAAPDVDDFIMNEWQALATKDPASGDWKHYPAIARPEAVFAWAEPGRAYAGQIVQGRDGRFWLYAPVLQKADQSKDRFAIGVAVADAPTGPWTDAHPSGPIISQTVPEPNTIQNIDPTVLIDDDGRVYIYWGTFGRLRGLELAADMVTPKGAEQTITGLDGFFEAPWLMKRKGVYYLVYAGNKVGPDCTPALYHACIAYGSASSPLGPWTYRGVILKPVSSTTSHPGAVDFKGQWWLAYHTADAAGGGHFRRSVAIDRMSWDDRASPPAILPVVPTRRPVPPPAPSRNIAGRATAAASNAPIPVRYWIKALNDGIVRPTPLPPDMWASDPGQARQWLEYRFDKPVTLNGARMRFWADQPAGATTGVTPPKAWRLEYWAEGWKPVRDPQGFGTGVDAFQSARFAPVTTRCVRVVLESSGAGLAVQEWEVLAPTAQPPRMPPVAAAPPCDLKPSRKTAMLRALTTLSLAAAVTLAAAPARAATPLDGVWLFDKAPSFPGVTMVQLSSQGGKPKGVVTSAWYGAMEMQNLVVKDGKATFDLRNLNDKAHPTRQWTAVLEGKDLKLVGDFWYAHAEQTGRRGTAKDAKARTFKPTTLPPLGSLTPDGLARTPPMGWSSWNKFAENIDDKTVRAMADALVATGLRDAGYVYVNIDDGWQGTRGPDGALRPNAKFPDMKALADYVHARGLKLGIYSAPGPKTCAGYEGSYGHVRQDARTFAGWGVDYLKYDLCSGEWFYDDADKVQRTYYEMGAALRATGRPIVYSLCEYGRFDVGAWGRRVGGHLWRTTGDITDDYPTMARIGFDKNGKPEHAGPGGWNDPDMLEIGNGGMSHDAYVTHMTLWAMSAAPLMMGHDLRQTSPEVLKLLTNREVIAVDQDALGVQGQALRREGAAEVWKKPLADGSVALAVFNRGDAPATIAVPAADAGFSTLEAVRDVWAGADLAPSSLRFVVPPQGAVLLKARGR